MYKRQVLDGAFQFIDNDVRKLLAVRLGNIKDTYHLKGRAQNFDRLCDSLPICVDHRPVSYTHLDVYKRQGYTQDTLSEVLGMTPNHLSAIERGASGISLEALQRLCRLLGVSADRIIFGTDDPEAEALALARRISDIKPEYRQQVQELLSAILNMS